MSSRRKTAALPGLLKLMCDDEDGHDDTTAPVDTLSRMVRLCCALPRDVCGGHSCSRHEGRHAKIERLVARPRPSAPPIPDPGAATARLTNAPEPAAGRVLLSDLPLVSMAFSDDPAVRGEFAKLLADLDKIICARAPTLPKIE
jgi:hypothetical protein